MREESKSLPLLYRTAKEGAYGQIRSYDTSSMADALFTYLDGTPSPESDAALREKCTGKPIVCMTPAWEEHIQKEYPDSRVFKRYMMKPACWFLLNGEQSVPDGFRVALFDEKAFDLHPFLHGKNYPSFAEFSRYGAGAVVWHGDRIVASASSFLSFGNEVELDVSTEEPYRRKGLAGACIALMLKECMKKGLTVHWDAQNEASKHLAERFGFETEYSYSVYFLSSSGGDHAEA